MRAFALSVDPANDTPESARRFLVERRVSGYLDFLVGPRSELQPVWRDYGFAPQTSEREHNSYVVLSPMYSTCRETCPLTAQQIRGALDDLAGDERSQVRAFALSVDPANDTADSARRFLVERRVSGYLDYLIGTRSDLQPIWRDYGFAPQTSEHEHNSYVVLIDKRGRQRVGFPIDYLTPEDLAHDIRVLLQESV